MADLLTVYDDDEANTFFECTICSRSLRGDTQYKIHLTTFHHLKKEEAQAALGLIPRPLPLPEWTDIKQYLKYLELDEPIIGLGALEQLEDVLTEDGKVQLRYKCKMCALEMDMCTMVSHVVSRKHRQKYLACFACKGCYQHNSKSEWKSCVTGRPYVVSQQLKRPDLVTWPSSSKGGQKQPGLVARAKAALVEKQEGWGNPVPLNRSSGGQRLKNNNQVTGHGTEEYSHSYTHAMSYSVRDGGVQSSLAEDGHRRSYLEGDAPVRPFQSQANALYDRQSRDVAAHLQSFPEDDGRKMTYYHDGRQRSYQDDVRTERPYLKEETSARSFLEDLVSSGRHHIDTTIKARAYNDKRQDEFYPDINRRGGWNSGQYDSYRDGVPGRKFTETEMSGSARHLNNPDYRENKESEGWMYTSHEGRGRSMDERERPRTSFQYAEGREHVRDVESTARAGSFEVKGYLQRHRDDLGDNAQEHSPAKRKRKSRFSDATPLEVALTQKSLFEAMTPKQNPREGSTMSQVSYSWMDQPKGVQTERPLIDHGFQETTRYERGSRDFQEARTFPNDSTSLQEKPWFKGSSRDFEGQRQIQDTAGYERKTYQEAATFENRPIDFQDSRHFQDGHSDFQQSRSFKESGFQHEGRFQDNPGSFRKAQVFQDSYQESARYEKLPRDFQESREFQDARTSFQQSSGLKDNPNKFQHGGRLDAAEFRQAQGFKDPYQESARYDNLSKILQESRHFQDDRTNFQQSRGFKDNPRDSQYGQRFKDDPDTVQRSGGFRDNPRGFQHGGRFEADPASFQQARSFVQSPEAGHVDKEPRSFQNVQHNRVTKTARGFEEHVRTSAEGRCSETDFRRSQSSLDGQREFEWNSNRRGSAKRPEDLNDYYPDHKDRRGNQESLWTSKPLREDKNVYSESQTQRPHTQCNFNSGAERYDPFNPSLTSSPPREVAPPSSLEKLAATLLELVARKSN